MIQQDTRGNAKKARIRKQLLKLECYGSRTNEQRLVLKRLSVAGFEVIGDTLWGGVTSPTPTRPANATPFDDLRIRTHELAQTAAIGPDAFPGTKAATRISGAAQPPEPGAPGHLYDRNRSLRGGN